MVRKKDRWFIFFTHLLHGLSPRPAPQQRLFGVSIPGAILTRKARGEASAEAAQTL